VGVAGFSGSFLTLLVGGQEGYLAHEYPRRWSVEVLYWNRWSKKSDGESPDGDHLEGKRENYQVCSVQYCVQQLCTVQCTHI